MADDVLEPFWRKKTDFKKETEFWDLIPSSDKETLASTL